MPTKVDYLVVGTGLTGAVIARTLIDAGCDVLMLERRNHLGGNVFDEAHPSGIRVHTYGPHYFRTNSERIWRFATRFSRFYRYEPALKSKVDDRLENWPIAASYIRETVGENWKAEFEGKPSNFKEAALSLMPRLVYEKFIKEYNEKQWGVPAESLAANLCTRFDVRLDDEPRLKPDCRHQGIPEHGYAEWMRNMVNDVPIMLNTDYLKTKKKFQARKCLIFTGPIDAYYGFDLGKLAYRGQVREHTYIADKDFVQPCGQVNNPTHAGGPHIRSLEWKHMMQPEFAERIKGTIVTTETPYSPTDESDYEYPFPDEANAKLYSKYRDRADKDGKLLICGRLGEYRYYDMDQAIARAMMLAEKLLERRAAYLPRQQESHYE